MVTKLQKDKMPIEQLPHHCMGSLTPTNADETPFGPWHDTDRYRPTSVSTGKRTFAVELKDSDALSRRVVEDLVMTQYVDGATRKLTLAFRCVRVSRTPTLF